MKRDYSLAREKVDGESRCRVCAIPNSVKPVEAAHLIARARVRPGLEHGEHPDNIVPLCGGPNGCHSAYDLRQLDVLPFIDRHEQAKAVELAGGILSALERLTNTKWAPVDSR